MPETTDASAVIPPQYNTNTFLGRTRYWAASINPRYLFETKKSIHTAQELLENVATHKQAVIVKDKSALADRVISHGNNHTTTTTSSSGNSSDALAQAVTIDQVYHARTVVGQCVHPTSGDIIPAPFRMCCFLPTNYLLVPFMMAPSTLASVPRTIFAQWLNQSYNAAVNYSNRSSDKQSLTPLLTAYAAAVAVACGGSWAVSRRLQRVSAYSTSGMITRATAPFLTVCIAAVVNLAVMRRHEWMTASPSLWKPSSSASSDSASASSLAPGGVAVMDEDGNVRGHSHLAGWDSLKKCAWSRVLWNMPCMMLPGVVMMVLPRYSALARRAPVLCESVLQMAGLTVGVPPALAVYDRVQHVSVDRLEEPFRHMVRQDGSPVRCMTYIKGV